MEARHPYLFLLLVLVTLGASPGMAETVSIDAAIRRADPPEIVRGPVTMRFDNLNKVRYQISIGQNVVFIDGPDLSLVNLIPDLDLEVPDVPAMTTTAVQPSPTAADDPSAAADAPPPPPQCPAATGGVAERFAALHACLSKEAVQVQNLVDHAKQAVASVNAQAKQTRELVAESDQILLANQGAALLATQVRELRKSIDDALTGAKRNWPTPALLAEHERTIIGLRKGLDDLSFVSDWQPWITTTHNYIAFRDLEAAAAKHLAALASLVPESDLGKDYARLAKDLATWYQALGPLADAEAYSVEVEVTCGYPFIKEKRVDFLLTRIDRTASDPAKSTSTEKLVQVVCPSRFTVSGGIAASGIVEQDFDFVSVPDGNGGLVSTIDVVRESDEQINPVLLISTRLGSLDWSHAPGAYGFHLSAGTVADYDNPEGGLKLGYLLGLSLSLMDDFLLTGGVQASRVGELADGYMRGDLQPMGLSEVPVTKAWHFDWVLGITYKIGGS
jgi:hypothetical protein